jgi:hypothetical protein
MAPQRRHPVDGWPRASTIGIPLESWPPEHLGHRSDPEGQTERGSPTRSSAGGFGATLGRWVSCGLRVSQGPWKSTVRVELARRGYQSFDTDEDGIAGWRLRATGEEVYDPGDGNHPDTWLRDHCWTINRARVEQLALMACDQVVFLCGSVENEDEVWELFDIVICLVLDEPTLRQRLATRATNKFGKAPAELKAILSWNRTVEATYREFGARVVNANQALTAVVDQVLANIGAELPNR